MTLEEFIEYLRLEFTRETKFTLNPQRQKEFSKAYREIESLLSDCIDARMWCEIGSLINGYAAIIIECDSIVVREIQTFCDAIKAADNFEIYPIADDKVRMDIMFHGIRIRA